VPPEDRVEVAWACERRRLRFGTNDGFEAANWQFVNRVAETNGSRYVVTFPVSEADRFFRLRKP
jgi:hypothetical protein